MPDRNDLIRLAAEGAVAEVRDGMVLGLGSGSTVARGGITLGVTRYVLAGSLTLAAVLCIALWFYVAYALH